ncbi:UNVERIFIED_CONTAM: hypothetical protein GTU68_023330 [Idotea baltica]|nr:hypothetical protein [Idotea baltica]
MTNSATLSPEHLALVKATARAVQENSLAITTRFYQRLFENHPETKPLFADTSPGQARRLANALVAYIENIDDISPIGPVVKRIAVKHVQAGVQPAHYDVVGQELLGAVVDVLGELPSDVLEAWAAAYSVLANAFIEAEASLMAEAI